MKREFDPAPAEHRLSWAHGRDRYDVVPVAHTGTLRDFAKFVGRRRAVSKTTAGYIVAPMVGDGRRCRANCGDRAWLALDVDGVDPDMHVEWRLFASRWRGFGWPTASSTLNSPRERIVIELDEAVGRDDGVAIGRLLVQDVEEQFGTAVRIDRCTFRAEQPCFLPVGAVPLFYLMGEPLRVQTWLRFVQPPPPPPPPATEVEALQADARIKYVVDVLGRAGLLRTPLSDGRGYAVRCPWAALHTTTGPSNDTSTALLFPSERNGWRGGFRCLHSHCEGRGLRDVLSLLAVVEEEAA
jgi:hypothetical protein